MDYLAICKRLRQEAGLSGTGPTTVTGQTGEMGRITDWAATAYDDVQNEHTTWRFLRTDFSFSTVASTQAYSPSDVSITDFATWIVEHRDGAGAIRLYSSVPDETRMQFMPWEEFREAFLFANNRTQTQRPTIVSVKPDNSLIFFAIPDAVYTVNGERYKAAAVLSGDTDEPNFPSRFHMIVVWKALMYYGAWAAAGEKYELGKIRYTAMLRKLEMDQLERPVDGYPLA
tara:strand:- start:7329 stop:8015 length:687 start_codon:yes stop_codon:yes gene_type:complete